MPQSLTKLYAHLVFSTKNREPRLDEAIRARVHAYSNFYWQRGYGERRLTAFVETSSAPSSAFMRLVRLWSECRASNLAVGWCGRRRAPEPLREVFRRPQHKGIA